MIKLSKEKLNQFQQFLKKTMFTMKINSQLKDIETIDELITFLDFLEKEQKIDKSA